MTQITAAMVKDLREQTGAGMMDAKKALTENNGDVDAAIDWLRSKGLAKAAKKSGRTAAEGLVAVALSSDGTKGSVVEINSETDFVARNDQFQTFVKDVAKKSLETDGSVDAIKSADYNGKSVEESLTDLIAKIGENMQIRRSQTVSVNNGLVANYVHNAVGDNVGKIGVLVGLESDVPQDKLESLGKQLAMHIAAAKPEFLNKESVDPEVLERERSVLLEQAKEAGKPADIAEKMVAGRIQKYYSEICLLEQIFVMDGETKVSDVIANTAKEAGASITLTDYARLTLGEGIEKEEEDFAAEVAKTAKSA
ncbi:MAG: elongation factor Ts [Micavibrio sp.]|nr:elongation factor Ts [Micavibrio sp.]|tara:strand:- start:376 stop:1305 length:930 start_codon:yes stop_codon:yes gene_type:complete